jgi:hypothetical protein
MKKTLFYLLFLTFLIVLLIPIPSPPTHHEKQTMSTETSGILQMNNAGNGYFFILSYENPASPGLNPIADNQQIHTNSLQIYIFNTQKPLTTNIPLYLRWKNDTEQQKYSLQANFQQMEETTIEIPKFKKMQEVNLTIENDTMQIFMQTIPTQNIPFYTSGPLGFLIFLGIILSISSVIGISVASWTLKRAQYFPPLTQRMWIALIGFSGIVGYTTYASYYYLIPTIPWELFLVPFIIIICLIVLDSYPTNAKLTLLIRFAEEANTGEIETGIWSILTAPSQDTYAPDGYKASGLQYIDRRSYKGFLERFFNRRINILWENGPSPEPLPQIKSKTPKWKMKDRKDKEHPFEEGYLLDPKPNTEPILEKEEKKGFLKMRRTFLKIKISGKHMQLAHRFLAEYTTIVEAGSQIQNLLKENARLLAQAEIGNNDMQDFIISETADQIFRKTMKKETQTNIEQRQEGQDEQK